ncbi:MAG: nicotinamide mononucleotide transporter [Acidobacteria bacterium]|nr:nicotinamide mononucleotide transporter [Acidobacteriota bacterium]
MVAAAAVPCAARVFGIASGMSPLEILGFVTGALCVWLLVRQNIWNWPLGLVNNALFIVLFYRNGLYADMGLQGFYIAIGVYGWWNWLHGGRDHGTVRVSRTPAAWAAGLGAGVLGGTFLLSFLLRRYTNSNVPLLDSLITALSLAAQFMMARKWLENWLVWLLANCLSIGLLIFKGLYLTSGLYAVYQVLCIMGWVEWWKVHRAAKPPRAPSEA